MGRFLRLIIIIGLPLIVAFATYQALRFAFLTPVDQSSTARVLFEIGPQASFQKVARDLKAQGLIRFVWPIEIIARLKGKDTSIQAGEYELAKSMSSEEILDKLASGKTFVRKITIKEGASIWEVGKLLEESGIMSRVDFEPALTSPDLLAQAGIPASSFEGYLFPDTYQFPKGTTAKGIIFGCLAQFNAIWNPEFNARLDQLKLSRHQLVTLASIIEKESGNTDEQPTISSVFHNRLKARMKLQADPTVIYGIPNFNGNLTRDDLQTPSPFNTYIIDGLPPGPIANPGLSAIRAALYPSPTDYLYFVADSNGGHSFSSNLEDHNRKVDMFQRNPSKRLQ